MKSLLRKWNGMMIIALVISLLTPAWGKASAQSLGQENGGVRPQAAAGVTDDVYVLSQDGMFRLPVGHINVNVDAPPQKTNYVALFTSGAQVTNSTETDKVFVKKTNTAIAVDKHDQVIRVIGPTAVPPTGSTWEENQNLPVPEGGYVLLANDSSWGTSVTRKPLFEHYKTGDTVSLHKGGQVVHAGDFLNPDPGLNLVTASGTTVTSPDFTVSGQVIRYGSGQGISLTVNGTEAALKADGAFQSVVRLTAGTNAIPVKLLKDGREIVSSTVTVTYNDAQQPADLIEVEAAPIDITISIEGPRHVIGYVDQDIAGIDDTVALFTNDWGPQITVPQFNVAVQVDAGSKVTKVVNPSIDGKTPAWTGPTDLEIPPGGYVLVAQDTSYASKNIKKYLATYFKVGDAIKLRKNGFAVPVKDLMGTGGPIARLTLDNYAMYTETKPSTELSGTITNMDDPSKIALTVNGTPIPFGPDGKFKTSYTLAEGINYLDLAVTKEGKEQDSKDLVVYSRPGFSTEKKVILWVDQAANARKLQTSDNVGNFLRTAKENGVTSVVFDVKGVEGYVSYKKSTLTGRPYVSEIKAPEKAGSNPDLDLLQEFIRYSRELGLDIHVAFNIFAEGSIASNEYALLDSHLDWEERVYNAADKGQIKRLRESAKQGAVAFVNPSNDEVRDFQLKTIEEVLQNYDVDGVVLDRARYDNESADFSDLTKAKFESFLGARGKQLQNWPEDVFTYAGNERKDGPLIGDWWEFRSKTIKGFTSEVRQLADRYKAEKGKKIDVSAYVGSWFESYYLNGVHWGSTEFRYDERLRMKDESVYTPGYYESGYVKNLDFIMIGAYQTTAPEIEHYITLGNIVTNGEVPLYAGIALTNVQEPALQREVFQAGLENTHGLMLFDASQVNWPVAGAALRNLVYVRDYQLGISLPDSSDSFLEGSYYNTNLIENNIGVLTDTFGYSTGNSRFGVEAVVDSSGKVTAVPNKTQAMTWNWGKPEETNSVIPKGGFVVSTLDASGIRTKRQLVANAYEIGDSVRAAALSGFQPYEGLRTSAETVTLRGKVDVLGPGKAVVTVNGQEAALREDGTFQADTAIRPGANPVVITVRVDGFKTNEKTVTIIGDETAAKSLKLDRGTYSMNKGESLQLAVTAEYLNSGKDVTGQAAYVSLDPSVVSVNASGRLTALKEGSGTVQATYEGHTATARVSVTSGSTGGGSDTDSGTGSGSGGGSAGGGGTAPSGPERTSVTETKGSDGQNTTIVSADASVMEAEIAALQGKADPVLSYEIPGREPAGIVSLPGTALRKAAAGSPDAILSVSSHLGAIELPAGLLLADFPADGSFDLLVQIARTAAGETAEIAARAAKEGMQVQGMPVGFRVSLKSGGETKEIGGFGSYVRRTVNLPGAVDPDRATVVELDPATGMFRFVPSRFETSGGAQRAVIRDRSGGTYAVVTSDVSFSDLASHWSRKDVELLAAKRIVDGMEGGAFLPDEALTRAQFAALLTRALALDPAPAAADFTDIPGDAWYAGAVGAAVQAGLADGFETGEFRPGEVLTREQMSVLLMRAMKLAGVRTAENSAAGSLADFADRGEISGWAAGAVSQAVEAGLLDGRGDGRFVPGGTATRAEGAAVLKRLMQTAGFVN
ncbi:S-layer homology domain-containing protein [Paenibacillus chitinolyticus]|uniref:S-layer homology domain-containing protein n=1 Tax=Paenibacillus chitinolyticus TaxID=79263 RepID=UPI003640E62D